MLSVVVYGDLKGNGYPLLYVEKWRHILVDIQNTLHLITDIEEGFRLI